jgi:hypothetical protein
MSLSVARIASLPYVDAALNYLAPMDGKPRQVTFDLAQGVPQADARYANARYERRKVAIYDARSVAGTLSLDDEGMQLVVHRTAVRRFHDEQEVKEIYYPEAEKLVAQASGAQWVLAFDHTVRQRVYGTLDRTPGLPRQPVFTVHNDYTDRSAPQRVRDLLGEAAAALLRRRFAVINVWRPIRGPLHDAPLAVCDAHTVEPQDLVASDVVYRHRIGETYAVRYNAAHRWLYIPGLCPNEALLFKCYDSRRDGVARFAPHCAFDDPSAPADRLIRESIELRTLAFFAD